MTRTTDDGPRKHRVQGTRGCIVLRALTGTQHEGHRRLESDYEIVYEVHISVFITSDCRNELADEGTIRAIALTASLAHAGTVVNDLFDTSLLDIWYVFSAPDKHIRELRLLPPCFREI